MKNEYLKTLWMLRFEKIRKTEEDAAWGYQTILDKCITEFGQDSEISRLLVQLVTEERMHERLADELINICRRTHTEFGLL